MNPGRGVPPLGILLLIASGVLGIVALIPFSAGVTTLRRDYRLAHDGVTVEGRVDLLEAVSYSISRPGDGGILFSSPASSSTTRVSYSFRAADGVAYHGSQGSTSAFVKGLSVGGPVRVHYVRSDPELSVIEFRPLTGYLFTTMGTLGLALVMGAFVAGLRLIGSGLGRGFIECTATVTELEDANYIVDSETYLFVRFQFSDAAGNDHWGKSPPLAPAKARAHAVGSQVRIRYDPRDTSNTRWLG